ncbi:MAG TPA: ABC transporter permease [Bryobacteraceae bacterium]|jgi:putative ABC transport system permease protein
MTLDDEIRDHLERETQENIERGMAPDEARHAALRKFGNVTRVKEETREVWRRVWLDQLAQDLRYGCRTLRRNPGFAAVVILTLALGIGMTNAIFSVVNAVLLRPLPYPNANRLVWLAGYDPSVKRDWAYSADFYQWRTQAKSYRAMAAYGYQEATIATAQGAGKVTGVFAGGDFWAITGARAALGRLFGPQEQGSIVISWNLFQDRFAADPRTVGSSVMLDGAAVAIAGVLPKNFRFEFPAWWQATDPEAVEIYVPMPPPAVRPSAVEVVAALKAGVEPARAQAELQVLDKRTTEAPSNRPRYPLEPTPRLEPLQTTITRGARPALLCLLAAAVFVLLIACVNITNLLLSRATVREREIAIRAAVGAGHLRVMRQLLIESLVLALAGGAAGLALAPAAIAALKHISPYAVPRLLETTIDIRTLAFALAASIATALMYGTGPALALWRTNLHDALKPGARSSGSLHGTKLRHVLVAIELSLALVLLAGAGLMLKSFWRMEAHPPGFTPEKVLILKLRFAGPQYSARPARERYVREALRRLETAPGVEAAGAGNWFTFAGSPALPSDPSPDRTHVLRESAASTGYLKAMGVQLLKGRWLTDNESAGAVLVNESLARDAFGSTDPIGRKLFVSEAAPVVVGVVSDLKYSRLDEETQPEFYVRFQQFLPVDTTIAVRTAGDPLTLAPAIRKLISGIDPSQPVYNMQTLEQFLADSIAPRRFNLFLLGSFAAAALLLAVVGIYGAIAYSVAQRTREMGVRLALGAERGRVILMVVREGMGVALAGIVVGLAAALGLAPVIANLLYDVKPTDPWALGAVAAGLALIALAACLAPALRAASIDPVVALRYE